MKKLLLALLAFVSLSASAAIIAPLPVTLQNGTTADANQVMSNFNAIVNNVNSNAAPLATSAQTNVTNTFTSPQIVPNATALSHAVNAGQIQQNGITFFADTGAANAYVATPAPAWASYAAGGHVYIKIGAGNTNTTASTLNLNGMGAKAILNEDLSNTEANALLQNGVYHLIYDGTQFVIIGKNNTAPTAAVADNSTAIATTGYVYLSVPAGTVLDFAGTSLPSGFVACDGASLLRAGQFAALFTAIGTTWGAADGTHFNTPNFSGRTTISSGTGSFAETLTTVTAAANAVAVASNSTKWITGMAVTVSGASGFAGLVNGSFFIVRVDATHISIASTFANAQNGSVVVVTGTGNATFTTTWTARSVGEIGGEESHAMSITELLAHGHTWSATNSSAAIPSINNTMAGGALTGTALAGSAYTPTGVANSTGGNAAMNNMQPFGVVRKIIKY